MAWSYIEDKGTLNSLRPLLGCMHTEEDCRDSFKNLPARRGLRAVSFE